MSSLEHRNGNLVDAGRTPEARYAYYRRCQVFRKGGEQCKAPAEKGSHICHAHAGQQATALRRERERQAVLTEAVAQMRRRGKPDYEAADLFMDFNGIQVTLAVMAKALIDGRIDCKTAGRLMVELQTMSKLLRVYHRGHREAQRTGRDLTTKDTRSIPLSQAQGRSGQATQQPELPQICAEERRLDKEIALTTKDTHSTPLSQAQGRSGQATEHEAAAEVRTEKNWASNQSRETRIALVAEVRAIANRRGWGHAPPELLRAA